MRAFFFPADKVIALVPNSAYYARKRKSRASKKDDELLSPQRRTWLMRDRLKARDVTICLNDARDFYQSIERYGGSEGL